MYERRSEQEIRDAVVAEMRDAAQEVESLTFAEVYDFDQDDIERAHTWQTRAVVSVAFRDDLDGPAAAVAAVLHQHGLSRRDARAAAHDLASKGLLHLPG